MMYWDGSSSTPCPHTTQMTGSRHARPALENTAVLLSADDVVLVNRECTGRHCVVSSESLLKPYLLWTIY